MARARAAKKQVKPGPGCDGAVMRRFAVQITSARQEQKSVRNRPGTFEWRYNRDDKTLTALYLAGVKFADMMERAGASDPHTVNWAMSGGAGWRGLPDGRVVALDELKGVMRDLGQITSSRLTQFCVRGHTTSEIARAYGVSEREMAPVLKMDLRELATILRLR